MITIILSIYSNQYFFKKFELKKKFESILLVGLDPNSNRYCIAYQSTTLKLIEYFFCAGVKVVEKEDATTLLENNKNY